MICKHQTQGQIFNIAPCTICQSIRKCRQFRIWYKQNRNKYIRFVIQHIKKFPEKYEIGVNFIMTQKKEPHIIIVEGSSVKSMKKVDFQKLPPEELIKYAGKEFPIATRSVEVIVQVKLKEKEWNGKFDKKK